MEPKIEKDDTLKLSIDFDNDTPKLSIDFDYQPVKVGGGNPFIDMAIDMY